MNVRMRIRLHARRADTAEVPGPAARGRRRLLGAPGAIRGGAVTVD